MVSIIRDSERREKERKHYNFYAFQKRKLEKLLDLEFSEKKYNIKYFNSSEPISGNFEVSKSKGIPTTYFRAVLVVPSLNSVMLDIEVTPEGLSLVDRVVSLATQYESNEDYKINVHVRD